MMLEVFWCSCVRRVWFLVTHVVLHKMTELLRISDVCFNGSEEVPADDELQLCSSSLVGSFVVVSCWGIKSSVQWWQDRKCVTGCLTLQRCVCIERSSEEVGADVMLFTTRVGSSCSSLFWIWSLFWGVNVSLETFQSNVVLNVLLPGFHTSFWKNITVATFTLSVHTTPLTLLQFENSGRQKLRHLKTMTLTPVFASWLGLTCYYVSFPDSTAFTTEENGARIQEPGY